MFSMLESAGISWDDWMWVSTDSSSSLVLSDCVLGKIGADNISGWTDDVWGYVNTDADTGVSIAGAKDAEGSGRFVETIS